MKSDPIKKQILPEQRKNCKERYQRWTTTQSREVYVRNSKLIGCDGSKTHRLPASHMGGAWERQIRSVRSILTALIREHGRNLDDESFRTLMAEVECIINSRPLTTPSSDPGDLDPLTPNHILTMKSKVVLPPPGNFQKEDVYLRKRWKRVQYLANVFWSRWRREYVQCLQQRSKWNRPRRNFEEGDLVLIVDDRVARNHWPLARIVHTYPDEEGYVRSVKVPQEQLSLIAQLTSLS